MKMEKKDKCELCEIILKDTNLFNKRSVKKPERCKSCENMEDKMSDTCWLCNYEIPAEMKYYKQYGNLCQRCNINIKPPKIYTSDMPSVLKKYLLSQRYKNCRIK